MPRAVVAMRCSTAEVVPAGDHDLLIGKLLDVLLGDGSPDPLVWFRRGFHSRKEPEYSR